MIFSRLNMLCTPLVWMRIAAIATLYTPSGYVRGMLQCSVQNSDFAATAVYNFCTLQFITCPDVVYKVATAAILIQTKGVQRVFSLENVFVRLSNKELIKIESNQFNKVYDSPFLYDFDCLYIFFQLKSLLRLFYHKISNDIYTSLRIL